MESSSTVRSLTPKEIDRAISCCLRKKADTLASEQIDIVLSSLSALATQQLAETYSTCTKKLLIAAQRAWHLVPSKREAIQNVVRWNVFDSYRPNDVEITTPEGTFLVNSLSLRDRSEHFNTLFQSSMQEGITLQASWASTFRLSKKTAFPMDRRIKLETKVSLTSLQVLLGSPLPEAAPVSLWRDLQYLQERRGSASQVLTSDSLLARFTSTLSPDNVIERYSQIALEDPNHEIPSINHFKNCCARLLIDNLESLEEWNAIAATLIDNGRDLLARGVQEHLEEIHHQDATDDILFAALSDPQPTIPITVAANLLLSRTKEHLQAHDSAVESAPASSSPPPSPPRKKKKLFDSLFNKRRQPEVPSALSDQPPLANPHKQWLQRFASLAPQIADYSRLDIEGLNPEQLGWLLDCIAPHALTLNLSGFNEASDASLWTRNYPKLKSLHMRNCAELTAFGGKRSHLPNLKSLDLSGSSRIRGIADGSGLSLSRLDVSHCLGWTHVAFFTNNVSDWLNLTGCKSEIAKSTQRLAPIRPSLSILS